MASQRPARQKEASDNSDDIIWDRRREHRLAGLATAHRSRDVVAMLLMTSTDELSANDAPIPPDPEDRNLSKRQWELRMQAWRASVKSFVQQATRE